MYPANYSDQMNSLLEMLYYAYTEFNSVGIPEFKAAVNPPNQQLRSLVETDGKIEIEVDGEAEIDGFSTHRGVFLCL